MTHRSEPTWERNAPSQIVLNSIFAALSATLIVIIIQDPQASKLEFWSLVLLVLSFLFFAVSAEKIVNALDEHDVRKYAYYMLSYNFGVICAGVAVELLALARFGQKITSHLTPYLGGFSGWIWFILPPILLWTWIRDSWWLFWASKADFDQWIEELEDKRNPEAEHGRLMKIFYGFRKKLHE